jgi:hypothetical protein
MKPDGDSANATRLQMEGGFARRSRAAERKRVMVGLFLLIVAVFVSFSAFAMITGDHALLSKILSALEVPVSVVAFWAARGILPVPGRVRLPGRGSVPEPRDVSADAMPPADE